MKAWITGLSRETGLGMALARQYLADGCTVFGTCRNVDLPHIHALQAQWGEHFVPVTMDVTDFATVQAAAALMTRHGKLDILISNATAADEKGNLPLDDGCDTEHMLNAYDVNAVGFLRLVQCFLPHLSAHAKIVAISSEAGSMAQCNRDFNLDYGMAKAALNFACVTLQRRLAPRGLRVLAIHPGWVQTKPAPPKADLMPEESAAHLVATIASPPDYVEQGNQGIFMWYDGRPFAF